EPTPTPGSMTPPSPSPPPADDVEETPKVPPAPKEPVGEVRAFRGHERSRVEGIAIATDDNQRVFVLSAGNDRTVRYWDLETGRELWSRAHEKPIFAVAFSHRDRRALSAGGDKIVRLWEVATGDEIA